MFKIVLCFSLLMYAIECFHNPHFAPGRTTIVHLFEWKWKDIAEECELFLGPYGFGGVQISPPNEHAAIWEPDWNREVKRPWFERYQPVSYRLYSRSGDEGDLRDMVKRCNAVGVRIYADAVINHMTGNLGEGKGIGGSYFKPDEMRYPGVPYSAENFNHYPKCSTQSGSIENYHDKYQVRNCKLSGLNDLDHSQEYVRSKVAGYLNHLLEIGLAGYRIDAVKHMWPGDMENIVARLQNLTTPTFPPGSRPFIFQEVIDLGFEPIKNEEYTHTGRVTEFKYGMNLGNVIRKNDNQKLKYLRNFGEGWTFLKSNNAVVFMDNHDNQRGHGAGGYNSILTFRDSRRYKMAQAFMLAWPYGVPKLMSSYAWPEYIVGHKDIYNWVGPPADENYNTLNVTRNADLSCGNGWICEHRWRQIYNMVKFRNVGGFSPMSNWWDNHNDQIAFGRAGKGFLAINNEDHAMDVSLQTGLSKGRYCDVISGNLDPKSGQCTARHLDVDEHGMAHIFVDNSWEDPMLAVHAESKIGDTQPAPAA